MKWNKFESHIFVFKNTELKTVHVCIIKSEFLTATHICHMWSGVTIKHNYEICSQYFLFKSGNTRFSFSFFVDQQRSWYNKSVKHRDLKVKVAYSENIIINWLCSCGALIFHYSHVTSLSCVNSFVTSHVFDSQISGSRRVHTVSLFAAR